MNSQLFHKSVDFQALLFACGKFPWVIFNRRCCLKGHQLQWDVTLMVFTMHLYVGFMMKLMVGHSVRDTHRVISAFVYCHVELTEQLASKSHRFVFHWLE